MKRFIICGAALFGAMLLPAAGIRVSPSVPQNLSPSGDDVGQLKKLTLGAGWEFNPDAGTTRGLKELGIRKIRCINVDLLPGRFDESGNYTVDRSKATRLDAHLATCRETGAVPHIIIAQRLPEEIRKVVAADSDEGRIMGLRRNRTVGPTDYTLYRNYQLAFFEHVLVTLGCRNAVFEAFNEPDIGGVVSPAEKLPARGSAELYDAMFRLYRELSEAARIFEKRHPDIPLTLGGPALSWAFTFRFGSFNWGERFVQDAAREKLKLDFIGVHFYGNITSLHGEYEALYPPFTEMLGSLKRVRDRYLPGVPIQINEWGPSYHVNTTEQSMVNADHIGAAWSAEFLKTMLEEGVDDALYLVTTDLLQKKEGKPENIWGWCGLFTNPHAYGKAYPKAAYNLFRMVSMLNGTRVESTRSGAVNSFAAAEPAAKTLRILAWNFGARIPENGPPVETAIAATPEIMVSRAAEFFGTARVKMTRYLLSRDTGNAYQVWKGGGALADENTVLPVSDRGEFSILNNELRFGLGFPPNSVSLIELEGAGEGPADAAVRPAAVSPRETPRAEEAAELPGNLFADPGFLRQSGSGKNGAVYVNAGKELARLAGGGIRIDGAHSLTMQAPKPERKEIRFSVEARGAESGGPLLLQINCMAGKRLISSHPRQVRPDAEWKPFRLSVPVPEECTHAFLLVSGGPAELREFRLEQ
ncbi:MAG: hypothetical protein HPZ91_09710 [Lentisphaeria bacterium]|nr:hypothetical protein [Lentisphaeria bacterium]